MGALLFVLTLALLLYCAVEALTSREDDIRHLPRAAWILLILFVPIAGPIGWLAGGRPVGSSRAHRPPEPHGPSRATGVDPEAEAEFRRRVRERAEDQRRRAREPGRN